MFYDFVVVGGGPVGSYTALMLAGAGHSVAVLEKSDRLGHKASCTGIIGQECAEKFGIVDSVILRRVSSATLVAPLGGSLRVFRDEPQACILDRSAFDIWLAERARGVGVEYILGCSVESVAVGEGDVKLYAGGRSFRARAVVLACGVGSGLTERLGLGRLTDVAAGVQADVATGVGEVEVYFGSDVAPGFFAWLVPTSQGRGRVGLLSRRNPGVYMEKLLKSLAEQGKIASGGVEYSRGAVPLKPLSRTYADRMLVVGDAAGQAKPTTGGGIYYGLICANIAADTLCRALQDGDFSAGRLSGYERGWGKRLKSELRMGRWARKLFEHLGDSQLDHLFDIMKRRGIAEQLSRDGSLSFDWHGKVAWKLLDFKIISGILGLPKRPSRTGRFDRGQG